MPRPSTSTSTSFTTLAVPTPSSVSSSSSLWTVVHPAISPATARLLTSVFGFSSPVPVQSKTIPLLLSHKDVLVTSKTGSGKTLAFLIPAVELLLKSEHDGVSCLIVAPTRELAEQIFDVVSKFKPLSTRIRPELFIGGAEKFEQDLCKFETKPTVVIGTPGRLLYVLQAGLRDNLVVLRHLDLCILDEADRLLDLGLEVQVNNILGLLPKQRRTGLFSATLTVVQETFRAGLRNPVVVNISADTTAVPAELRNHFCIVQPYDKLSRLLQILEDHQHEKIIVYVLTCAMVDYFSLVLSRLLSDPECSMGDASPAVCDRLQMTVIGLHGQMHQKKRNSHFQQFASKKDHVLLLCTDVAARGIDLPDVDLIVQYDPPQDPTAFIHRIGRTARAGRTGSAIVLLSPAEDAYIEFLKNKRVPLSSCDGSLPDNTERQTDPPRCEGASLELTRRIRRLAVADRDIVEKGADAFVSFVRAYKEHQLSLIFDMSRLDFGQSATCWGLLIMPSIPEIRRLSYLDANGRKTKNKRASTPSASSALQHPFLASFVAPEKQIRLDEIAFADKKRELARQERLTRPKNAGGKALATATAAADSGADHAKAKLTRQQQQQQQQQQQHKETKKERDKRKRDEERNDLENINREASLLKKLRRGKISEEEFELLSSKLL